MGVDYEITLNNNTFNNFFKYPNPESVLEFEKEEAKKKTKPAGVQGARRNLQDEGIENSLPIVPSAGS